MSPPCNLSRVPFAKHPPLQWFERHAGLEQRDAGHRHAAAATVLDIYVLLPFTAAAVVTVPFTVRCPQAHTK
jgi:hypothetical protein